MLAEVIKEFAIFYNRHLERLCNSSKPVFWWKRLKKLVIYQHSKRRRKRTRKILHTVLINPVFNANTGISLGKDGRWDSNEPESPMDQGCSESHSIQDATSSDCQNMTLAAQMTF